MKPMFANRVALITGGSSGIGLATARRFIDEGAEVALVARDQARLDDAARGLGASAFAVRADVARIAELEGVVRAVKERFGRVDVLFANAGGGAPGSIAELTEEQFDDVFALNVKSVFFLLQKCLPILSEGASVVLTTSIANARGLPGGGAYGASKAALRSFARTWAAELKGRKIRVNAVSPGPIDTPLHQKLAARSPEVARGIEAMVARLPVGRIGRAEEVAAAVAFLASEQASFITGLELVIDGGLTETG